MPVLRNRKSLIRAELLDGGIEPGWPGGVVGLNRVMTEVLHAWLNSRLNQQVKHVEMDYDVRRQTRPVAVEFRNGHVLHTTAEEAKTSEFLATCLLIYDLPPKR